MTTVKAIIEWEHGDADTRILETYTITDIDLFLRFIFDLKGWSKERHYFDDGHEFRKSEYVAKINEKYNHEFSHIIPSDIRFSNYRPAIDKIYLKFGNKIKYVVWNNILSDAKHVEIPKKDKKVLLSTGNIGGFGKDVFGGKLSDYLYFSDLKKDGIAYKDEDEKSYNEIECIFKDVKIYFNKNNMRNYRSDYTTFFYVFLYEYKGKLISSHNYGYNKDLIPDEDFLYFFNG